MSNSSGYRARVKSCVDAVAQTYLVGLGLLVALSDWSGLAE
jgi:hypothetical protein